MKRVLLLSPDPNLSGGIARWTGHVIKYYENHGNACLLRRLSYKDKQILGASPFIRICIGMYNYFFLFKSFRNEIKKEHYDIAHLTSSASISLIKDILFGIIASKKKVKSIVHFRFGRIPELAKKKNWEWKLIRIVANNVDLIIVIDESSYHVLLSEGIRNVIYVPNPISDDIIDNIAKNKNIQRQKRELVFVGQMLVGKGIYELVEVCKSIPNIKLNMYGKLPNDKTKGRLLELAGFENEKWLNIAGEIEYSTVVEKMLSANVFVLPTYTEGFPNVILESMACSCPIVASAVGAIPEMLDINGKEPCGICIKPKDKIELKNAIEFMLANPEKAELYGKRAKERVVKEYSMKAVWDRLTTIWETI